MLPQLRLCFPFSDAGHVGLRNGKIHIQSFASKSIKIWTNFAMKCGNISQIASVRTNHECIGRLARNESDFSLGYFDMQDAVDESYFVPVPAFPNFLYFLSGYNVYEYEKQLTSSVGQTGGILKNFYSFSFGIYLSIVLWLVTLFFIIMSKVAMRQNKRTYIRIIKRAFRYIVLLMMSGSNKFLLLTIVMRVGLFFILTPFCILFKTNQLYTEAPVVISSYEEIIQHKAQIGYMPFNTNVTKYMEEQINDKNKIRMQRIWNYFKYNSRRVAIVRSPGKLAKAIVDKKMVIIGPWGLMEGLRQVYCTWTLEPDLYQIFRFRDPNQREILTGLPFRKSHQLAPFFKRLRHNSENHLFVALMLHISSYRGIEVLPNSQEHRQHQLSLCQRERIIHHQKNELLASDLSYFGCFFKIIALFFLLCVPVLLVEQLIKCTSKGRVKRRTKKNIVQKEMTRTKRIYCFPYSYSPKISRSSSNGLAKLGK